MFKIKVRRYIGLYGYSYNRRVAKLFGVTVWIGPKFNVKTPDLRFIRANRGPI